MDLNVAATLFKIVAKNDEKSVADRMPKKLRVRYMILGALDEMPEMPV